MSLSAVRAFSRRLFALSAQAWAALGELPKARNVALVRVFREVPGSRRARRLPRGAAAAEFAIIAPLLLLLIIGTLVFGLVLITRYQMQNITTGAVRTCVAMQQSTDSTGKYKTCAENQANLLYGQLNQPCATFSATANTDISPTTGLSFNGTGQKIQYLQLKVVCGYNVGALAAFVPGMNSVLQLNVTSAMPFVWGPR